MADTRPVLRIFISSTAIDLTAYRDRVRDAVLRLENLPIEMKTFSALGGDCMCLAAELYRCLGDHAQSIAEAEAGILLADTCGYGQFSIDLRIALAETLLDAGEPHKALQNARAALDRSEDPECQYAWGKADGLHFCGIAHMRLGERELARQRLTAALEIREKLTHGRIEETRRALAQVTAS